MLGRQFGVRKMPEFAKHEHGPRSETIAVGADLVPPRKALRERSALAAGASAVHVRLEKLATGCWSVCEETGRRGGLFRDYASATLFIRREFAARRPTVVEMVMA
jgi:hypothetical protein